MLITDLDQFKKLPVPTSYPSFMRTFYVPHEDTHPVIMAILNECKASLVLSMFGLTDKEAVARIDELLDTPHVYCQLNLDKRSAAGKTEAQVLARFKDNMTSNNIAIGNSSHGEINHDKLLVVDGIWTISGSTNWSLNGEQRQNNQLTVTYSSEIAAEARYVLDMDHSDMLTQMARRRAA